MCENGHYDIKMQVKEGGAIRRRLPRPQLSLLRQVDA